MSPAKLKKKPAKAKPKAKAKAKSKLTRIQQKILNQAKSLLANDKSYRLISPNDFLNEKTIGKVFNSMEKYDLMRAKDWSGCLSNNEAKINQFLVNNVLEKLEKNKISIIELKPQQRNIVIQFEYNLFDDDNHEQTFYLDFPYVQFIKFPGGTYVSCSNKPITNWNSVVGYLPLPNGGENGLETYICFGNLPKTPEDIITSYFTRKFNSELSYALDFPKEIKNFRVWEKNTRLNPGFSLGVKWDYELTIGEIIVRNITNIAGDGDDW